MKVMAQSRMTKRRAPGVTSWDVRWRETARAAGRSNSPLQKHVDIRDIRATWLENRTRLAYLGRTSHEDVACSNAACGQNASRAGYPCHEDHGHGRPCHGER